MKVKLLAPILALLSILPFGHRSWAGEDCTTIATNAPVKLSEECISNLFAKLETTMPDAYAVIARDRTYVQVMRDSDQYLFEAVGPKYYPQITGVTKDALTRNQWKSPDTTSDNFYKILPLSSTKDGSAVKAFIEALNAYGIVLGDDVMVTLENSH